MADHGPVVGLLADGDDAAAALDAGKLEVARGHLPLARLRVALLDGFQRRRIDAGLLLGPEPDRSEKIDKVVESAESTFGLPMIEEERRTLQVIAAEGRRAQKASNKARRRVEKLTKTSPSAREMSDVVGKTTAAVLVAAVGDPRNYESPSSYEKSVGLNLKETSSGKKKGGLHITKRGPGIARLFLFMAVLRLIQEDDVIRAWYRIPSHRRYTRRNPADNCSNSRCAAHHRSHRRNRP